MSDEDFKEKMFKQLEAIANKQIDVEKKIDTVHSGIYGDINYKGLKEISNEHANDIVEIKENTRYLTWINNNTKLSLILIAVFIEAILELNQHGLISWLISK